MATKSFFEKIVGGKTKTSFSVKAIAVVLSLVATVWLLVSVTGERWVIVTFVYLEAQTWDWGLWNTCHDVAPEFHVCVDGDWLGVCLVFSTVALTFSVCATLSGLLGLRCAGSEVKRNSLFTGALVFLVLVVILEFVVAVVYPVKFGADITKVESVKRWDFDWSYGFAWGGIIFSMTAALFYLVAGNCAAITGRCETHQEIHVAYEHQ